MQIKYDEAIKQIKDGLRFLDIGRAYTLGDFSIPEGLMLPITRQNMLDAGSGDFSLNVFDIVQNMLICTSLLDDLPLNDEYEKVLTDLFSTIETPVLESLLDVRHLEEPLRKLGVIKGFAEHMNRSADYLVLARHYIALYQSSKEDCDMFLEKAKEALYMSLDIDESADVYYLLSYVHSENKERELAYDYALRALDNNPEDDVRMALESGMHYLFSQKTIEEARLLMETSDFSSAIELLDVPEVEESYEKNLAIGEAYTMEGEPETALNYLNKAREIEPTRANVYSSLGLASFMAGDSSNALRFFETGLRIEPLNIELIKNVSLLYSRTGRSDVALKLMYKARDLAPDDLEVLDIIADIKYRMEA